MSDDLDIGRATDVGRVRESNEDALLVAKCTRSGARSRQVVVAVADGMGGHKAGEVASALAVETLQQALDDGDPESAPDEFLKRSIEAANRTIWEAAAEDIDKEGMGTTLVAALLEADGQAVIANVGDSRAYWVTRGAARLVTIDHTWVNQQVLANQMSERDARSSPFRNLLTRSLGNLPRVEVDVFAGIHLEAGDALVLVSDGVTGYLDEKDVSSVVHAASTAQQAAEALVREAIRRGGADNATAVVVRRR